MPEEKSFEVQAKEKNAENAAIIGRLKSHGFEPNNLPESRHEMFIHFLVEEGYLPDEDFDKFNLKWENHLNEQLVKLEVQVQQQIRRAQLLQHPSTKPRLIVPGRENGKT